MKKKKYRLETVLNVRQKNKDEAASYLAVCRQKLLEEEQELERRIMILKECIETIRQANEFMQVEFSKGVEAQRIISHKNYIKDLQETEEGLILAVEQQKNIVIEAEKEVEKATENLILASKEVQVIEKHKEQWQETEKLTENKKEQKLSDEIGSILHQRSDKL